MVIERIGAGAVRPPTPADVRGVKGTADDESPSERSAEGERSDSVELSQQGLARAAEMSEENSVSTERMTEIRDRIAAAAYDEPSVAAEVARRLIESGDLRIDPTTT